MKPDSQSVAEVLSALTKEFPNPKTELIYDNPFELIIAVILSAQCTDARVNQTTPALFKKYPTPKALSEAKAAEVEKLIHACGFFRAKTKAIISTASDLHHKFGGKVPGTLEELVTLAGVGRKTASVVLNQAFDVPAIAVDTHVKRVSHRLGWAKHPHPDKIEFELKGLVPEHQWAAINGLLILHGRKTCKARTPLCDRCSLTEWCAFAKARGETAQRSRPKASSRKKNKGTVSARGAQPSR